MHAQTTIHTLVRSLPCEPARTCSPRDEADPGVPISCFSACGSSQATTTAAGRGCIGIPMTG